MTTTEKQLLKIVSEMTRSEWAELRKCLSDDKRIMGLLDVIGKLRGWRL